MGAAVFDEKRQHPRTPYQLSVRCLLDGSSNEIQGTTKDIGLGGMFVASDSALAFDTKITVVLALPGIEGETRIPATVRWSTSEGFGVQFGLLGARETHALTDLMRKHS